ncbi:MAG: hypothetical protein NC408_02285 [Candidatus Gastranaerophilales bacterium]|nr:hypothetical protein [Candidatus Gastranaerophilales bacterium]MCM1073461.1 hypothetical protein [Bacteroides sp.]
MTQVKEGLQFDPGFAPYILAFRGMVEYLYTDISRFKNLSQKKVKFRQYYKKILLGFDNNMGFYAGCLMWAAYIKTQPEQEILGNHCLGQTYNAEENISETQFMLWFAEQFKKDMKYYLGETFAFDEKLINLIKLYEEFLTINKGFTESKTNTDILLPKGIEPKDYKKTIDKVLETGKLEELIQYLEV